MKPFDSEEIRTFLKAVDSHLTESFEVEIIGGAAASLSFELKSGTLDIDTLTSVEGLTEAIEKAREETKLNIPMAKASVSEVPYEYASRLKEMSIPGITKLNIRIPEKHDWALMKVARGYENDISGIKGVHQAIGLDPNVLRERFVNEMSHVEPRGTLIDNFLAMVEELYGEPVANKMERAIRSRWKPS